MRYKIKEQQLPNLDEAKIRAASAPAMSLRLQPELINEERKTRLPQINESAISTPAYAIETYLNEVMPERKESLLLKTKELTQELDTGRDD